VVEDAAVAVLQVVEAGYEVGEHGRLHVEAARRSLGRKQAGQSLLFCCQSFPNQRFHGTLSRIGRCGILRERALFKRVLCR
jgi:hypothetical protein